MIRKLIEKIKKKLFLIIGRGILALVESASEKTMKIQIDGLSGETITGVERLQEYGFESYPEQGEVIILAPGGNRDQGVCIKVHDRENRPKTLNPGEVCVWNKAGQLILLTSTQIKLNSGIESFVKGNTFNTWLSNFITVIYNLHTHAGAGQPPVPLGTAPTNILSSTIKGE